MQVVPILLSSFFFLVFKERLLMDTDQNATNQSEQQNVSCYTVQHIQVGAVLHLILSRKKFCSCHKQFSNLK